MPSAAWEYQIGNFPVLRKWLEGRRTEQTGRPLRLDEVEAFSDIVRRIAALVVLGDELDSCHERIIAEGAFAPGSDPPG